jgi:hypothetical protein
MLDFGEDVNFWRNVSEQHWHRDPFAFTVDPSAAPFTEEQLFAALVSQVDHDPLDWVQIAVSDSPAKIRDYRLGTFRRDGPQPADDDFDGYFRRMAGVSFGLNVHDLGRRDTRLAGVPDVFDAHLGRHPLSPVPRKWELDTFVGNYAATPFGIHRDNAGVFSFCLVGRRTVMLWEDDYFAPGHADLTQPDPLIIARHAGAATKIELAPGLGAYWPPGNWHVVLSDGNPFAVAQVSAYFDPADLGR